MEKVRNLSHFMISWMLRVVFAVSLQHTVFVQDEAGALCCRTVGLEDIVHCTSFLGKARISKAVIIVIL
jgi:hypothetical protein